MPSFKAGQSKIYTRVAAGLGAVALAVAAPAALASSSTSAARGVVHAHIDRTGTVVVTGYDGGVGLLPPAGALPARP